jgi:hypothetical protein
MQTEAEKNLNTRFYVEHETNDYTCNNLSHWNSNDSFNEKFGNHTGGTFNRFTTKDNSTWNITHNTESTSLNLEGLEVGISVGLREVPGRKGL